MLQLSILCAQNAIRNLQGHVLLIACVADGPSSIDKFPHLRLTWLQFTYFHRKSAQRSRKWKTQSTWAWPRSYAIPAKSDRLSKRVTVHSNGQVCGRPVIPRTPTIVELFPAHRMTEGFKPRRYFGQNYRRHARRSRFVFGLARKAVK